MSINPYARVARASPAHPTLHHKRRKCKCCYSYSLAAAATATATALLQNLLRLVPDLTDDLRSEPPRRLSAPYYWISCGTFFPNCWWTSLLTFLGPLAFFLCFLFQIHVSCKNRSIGWGSVSLLLQLYCSQ
ncbi:hypothetical protein MPTK1_1g26640 [Marchantia polymorpha subsp. ruderalis]|uniref:Uncharacterized protein n=2 Tax=Marchantia polymorpha TaxID=3197 RepID=A0AAF6AUK7_MARPO|nr:hypothetical protein MARPO_0002s0214 [Marchantia polymorpha]BBN00128.1 hypothetical protein Mp_1g26640 [Marchantia polymorpha subsp. ruderalis]|eukprot:PTQ49756.1 hypothetical protein MARPO_0002s0214 [Marchantia polymorpha]